MKRLDSVIRKVGRKVVAVIEHHFTIYGLFRLQLSSKARNRTSKKTPLPDHFQIKMLEATDMRYFEQLALRKEHLDIYATRLKDGSNFECHAVIDTKEDRLAYYSWINFNDNYFVKEIKRNIDLKSTYAVLFESDETIAEYRRQGIHHHIMHHRIGRCIALGIKDIYIVIQLRNTPALRTVRKFSFKRINWFPIYYRTEALSFTMNRIRSWIFR